MRYKCPCNNSCPYLVTLLDTLRYSAEKFIRLRFLHSDLVTASAECKLKCLSCPQLIFLIGIAPVSYSYGYSRICTLIYLYLPDILEYLELLIHELLYISFFHDDNVTSACYFLVEPCCRCYPFYYRLFDKHCYLTCLALLCLTLKLLPVVKHNYCNYRT